MLPSWSHNMFRVVAAQFQFNVQTCRIRNTLNLCKYVHEFKKEFWHINYLSGGYLTPPSLDFYFVVGGKHGLVKFRDDQWWSFPWPEEGDLDTFQCPMSPALHWSLSQPLLGPNMKSIILHQSNYCHPQATTFLTLSPLNATNHRNI